jgi:hypothetical protein
MQKWFGSSGVCINENGLYHLEDKKKTKLLKNVVLERLKKKQDILWN